MQETSGFAQRGARAAEEWVEADEAELRMEPRRLTQCSADLRNADRLAWGVSP